MHGAGVGAGVAGNGDDELIPDGAEFACTETDEPAAEVAEAGRRDDVGGTDGPGKATNGLVHGGGQRGGPSLTATTTAVLMVVGRGGGEDDGMDRRRRRRG